MQSETADPLSDAIAQVTGISPPTTVIDLNQCLHDVRQPRHVRLVVENVPIKVGRQKRKEGGYRGDRVGIGLRVSR
jgi:hypothetical protein